MELSLPSDPAREKQALGRLLPRLEQRFHEAVGTAEWDGFTRRLRAHFPGLFRRLFALYGQHYDFFYHLECILATITEMWFVRPDELKALDALRETDPHWYQSSRMVGAMGYVDRFAGNLAGLAERIPYLNELGVTYLHLMPLFESPAGDNDGGYAVSSFRKVDPRLGTMEELAELAGELRRHGISLVLDFVFNHTSDEHEWAKAALAGDEEYQAFYRMYPDRSMPDAFERSMGEVFPDEHPGAFTYRSRIGKWVWTTFHNYQWDLNYENPVVLNRMIEEMLFLLNQGVEVVRLDAVAFVWKQLGTDCQNLPQAHWIIQAFSAAAKIAAPAAALKSEAIVHPAEVRKYVNPDECQLSYNPELMALLWNSMATREVKLLNQSMRRRFTLPEECDWVNYIRCHDDIGWTFDDEDLAAVGFNAVEHRRFLTRFYTGRFEGSFARGVPFQENPKTGDGRVSGTTASLVGLEQAVAEGDEEEIDLCVRRLLLLHGVIMTIGGIPLIYLGDAVATLNDYTYDQDPEKIGDTRWLHRGVFDWDWAEHRHDPDTISGRVFNGLLRLVQLRKQNLAFSRAETEFVDTGNPHVFGYFRTHDEHSVLVLANFSEAEQQIEGRHLRLLGLRKTVIDMVSGRYLTAAQQLEMEPYQFMVLARTAS